jgi:hypothetical protein
MPEPGIIVWEWVIKCVVRKLGIEESSCNPMSSMVLSNGGKCDLFMADTDPLDGFQRA